MARRTRTALFVPGDRPARIAHAVTCRTDAVVVDFEDAVAARAKEKARTLTQETLVTLEDPIPVVMVRVNASDSVWFHEDMAVLATLLPRVTAVLLPKSASASMVRELDTGLARLETTAGTRPGSTRVLPIIETAAGVLAAMEIAACSRRIGTLLFGSADLSTELSVTATAEGNELLYARSRVVLAAAASGVARPIDGPHLTLDDSEGLAQSAERARRLGFGGKVVIHPSQLDTVSGVFAPTDAELEWAKGVDHAFAQAEDAGRGSIRLEDGTFVDYPVAKRARALLTEAQEGQGG